MATLSYRFIFSPHDGQSKKSQLACFKNLATMGDCHQNILGKGEMTGVGWAGKSFSTVHHLGVVTVVSLSRTC